MIEHGDTVIREDLFVVALGIDFLEHFLCDKPVVPVKLHQVGSVIVFEFAFCLVSASISHCESLNVYFILRVTVSLIVVMKSNLSKNVTFRTLWGHKYHRNFLQQSKSSKACIQARL